MLIEAFIRVTIFAEKEYKNADAFSSYYDASFCSCQIPIGIIMKIADDSFKGSLDALSSFPESYIAGLEYGPPR